MKRRIAMAAVVAAALVWNLQLPAAPSSKPPFDEEEEKKAVLATIDAETNSFYRRDYDSWKKHYIHASYAFQAWNNADGTFDARTGWNEVDKKIGEYIKAHPVQAGTASHPRVEKRNLVVKFYGNNVAYLVWDQYNSDKEIKQYTYSKEVRIMEKELGEWKIVNVSAFWDYKNKLAVTDLK